MSKSPFVYSWAAWWSICRLVRAPGVVLAGVATAGVTTAGVRTGGALTSGKAGTSTRAVGAFGRFGGVAGLTMLATPGAATTGTGAAGAGPSGISRSLPAAGDRPLGETPPNLPFVAVRRSALAFSIGSGKRLSARAMS